jgi:putative membrane protein
VWGIALFLYQIFNLASRVLYFTLLHYPQEERTSRIVNTLSRGMNIREVGTMGGGMMGSFGGAMGGLGLFGGLFSLLLTIGVLVGLVFLGIWLWHRLGTSGEASAWIQPPAAGQTSALDILRTRYARGELTRKEYQGMLQDLA